MLPGAWGRSAVMARKRQLVALIARSVFVNKSARFWKEERMAVSWAGARPKLSTTKSQALWIPDAVCAEMAGLKALRVARGESSWAKKIASSALGSLSGRLSDYAIFARRDNSRARRICARRLKR